MSLQMTTIYVCIGSACHLKGSYDIINRLQALIAKQELGERVVGARQVLHGELRSGRRIRQRG